MTIVVDSSVAIKWFVIEPLHRQAAALLDGDEELLAPSILLAEVANGLWRKVRLGEADARQVDEALDELETTLTLRTVDAGMTKAAFEIAQRVGHSIYDCLFLACAVAEKAKLATADSKFAGKLAADELGGSVHLLTA